MVVMLRGTTWLIATAVGVLVTLTLLKWTILAVIPGVVAFGVSFGILSAMEKSSRRPGGGGRSREPAPVEREKIIERQVLVARCQYCGELTPVDLVACKSCGARIK